MSKDFQKYLEKFVTPERSALFDSIIENRTNYITIVLEDVFQSHNISAILRTCDCFGIHDVHIIENKNEYKINPDVALGSNKWLNLKKYNNTKNNTIEAIKYLKEKKYRIIATTPHKTNTDLGNFNLNKGKIALIFGTELTGLSDDALNNSDEFLKIPMSGFTESFNISVSAGIILHYLTFKLRKSKIKWQLNDTEKTDTKIQWLKNSIKSSELIEKQFLNGDYEK